MTEKVIPKQVKYRILIPNNRKIYKVGLIIVDVFHGDIYYQPSQSIRVQDGQFAGVIEHVSFHKSGQVSVKFRDVDREILSPRQQTKDLGYQIMFQDDIFHIGSLPEFTRTTDQELLFNSVEDTCIRLEFSIVSGRLIAPITHNPQLQVTTHMVGVDDDLLAVVHRALGWHSGNADKLMQFSLHRIKPSLDKAPIVKRTLFIPSCFGVTRPGS